MAKQNDEVTVLSLLQDILIFQMASAGVPQSDIRQAVRLDMKRVNRIARVAQKIKKAES